MVPTIYKSRSGTKHGAREGRRENMSSKLFQLHKVPKNTTEMSEKGMFKSYLQNLVQGVNLGRFYKLALKTKVFTPSEY